MNKMQRRLKYKFNFKGLLLLLIVLLLTMIGVILIGYVDQEASERQFAGAISGIVVLIIFSLIDYRFLLHKSRALYIADLFLLLLVRMTGASAGGAERWLEIGGVRFQPSELSKIILILFFADFFERHSDEINRPKVLMMTVILIAVPCVLILGQPALSTTIIVLGIFLTMLFLAGLSAKIIRNAMLLFIPLAGLFVYILMQPSQRLLRGYQYERIMAWLNPEEWSQEAYQQQNSIMAIGSGGLEGSGLITENALSAVRNGFVPESHTDFIMTVAGEVFGFIGCISIILLLFVLCILCISIGRKTTVSSARLICAGAVAWLGMQSFVNICVTTGLLPNTGTTLPFISYGLTSLLVCFSAIGIVINIGLQTSYNKRKKISE